MNSPKLTRLMRRAAVGIAGCLIVVPLLAVLGVHVWLFLASMYRLPTQQHFIQMLFLWQTEVGAACAIATAVIGATLIWHQTATTQRLDRQKLLRRAKALRAALPIALSEVSEYAVECAEVYGRLLLIPRLTPIQSPGLGFPALPALVNKLNEIIENVDGQEARPFVVLLSKLQIHSSRAKDTQFRAESANGSLLLRFNLVGRVIDSAEIYARCAKLLHYARSGSSDPAEAVTPADIRQALHTMPGTLEGANMDEVDAEIERRAAIDPRFLIWLEN